MLLLFHFVQSTRTWKREFNSTRCPFFIITLWKISLPTLKRCCQLRLNWKFQTSIAGVISNRHKMIGWKLLNIQTEVPLGGSLGSHKKRDTDVQSLTVWSTADAYLHLLRSRLHWNIHLSHFCSKQSILFRTCLTMPSAGRVKVSICNGETNTFLEEYQIVTAGPKTECWIESKEKSRFSIEVSVTPPDGKELDAFRITVFVDGQPVDRGVFGQINKTFRPFYCFSGLRDTRSVLKPFTFAKTRFMGIMFQPIFLTFL